MAGKKIGEMADGVMGVGIRSKNQRGVGVGMGTCGHGVHEKSAKWRILGIMGTGCGRGHGVRGMGCTKNRRNGGFWA